jgi:hypothetical protein
MSFIIYQANPEESLKVMSSKEYTQKWRRYYYYWTAVCPSLREIEP